ncbi:hypothetical protein [Aerolutibacter ruishenii]|uniref:Uncharacterized protein n=1 Tax=Aerolutibacter ruishenii TaxID=686800 RepID=A0A562LKT5_9GAMM|nr:hypothetical protein [Lysobacter ruishenii]TWI08196.1 hypothetical protein IP93_02432 [Lysobacter ruishenii]
MTNRLHIGEHQTSIQVDDGPGEPDTVVLPLGALALARRHFHHQPPTATELELAIEAVEDALMPLVPRLRGPGTLLTSDDESIALAAFAGRPTHAAVELDLDTVERQFNRLADVANGRPASSEGLPPRATFAAHLLILRELMHHAARRSLTVVATAPPAAGP